MNWHYFITISPPDRTNAYSRMKYKNPNQCVFIDDNLVITSVMKKNKITRYVIWPEFDDKGRLHYHGRIRMTDSQRVSLFKSVKPRLEREIGFVDLEPVKRDLENLFYCRKTWSFTMSLLEIDHPISPQIPYRAVGGRRGFKSQRDLLDSENPITNYFDI